MNSIGAADATPARAEGDQRASRQRYVAEKIAPRDERASVARVIGDRAAVFYGIRH